MESSYENIWRKNSNFDKIIPLGGLPELMQQKHFYVVLLLSKKFGKAHLLTWNKRYIVITKLKD